MNKYIYFILLTQIGPGVGDYPFHFQKLFHWDIYHGLVRCLKFIFPAYATSGNFLNKLPYLSWSWVMIFKQEASNPTISQSIIL